MYSFLLYDCNNDVLLNDTVSLRKLGCGAPTVSAAGWAVDPTLPRKGWGPVTVALLVDSKQVAEVVANVSRGDLVKAHVARKDLSVTIVASLARRLM
jgi:hypothetical protein